MISKQQVKYLNSLQVKKYRKLHQSFLVQGAKSVQELIKSDYVIKELYATDDFLDTFSFEQLRNIEVVNTTEKELAKVSTFQSNNSAVAVAEIPVLPLLDIKEGLVLMLDRVNDPGNLGTIIRLADWYGIKTIICSEGCVDIYSPKVVSSTMGSFARVEVFYTDLEDVLSSYKGRVYGALLEGENLHTKKLNKEGVVLMGSESQGIQDDLLQFVTDKITIPSFGEAESLNVAMATAIILDNFRRG